MTAAPRRAVLLGVFLALTLIWGSTWLFIKVGLEDLPPIGFAGLRFVVAVVALFVFARWRGAAWPRGARAYGFLALTGFLSFTLNYGLLFWGEQYTPAGLAAVLQATIPVFSLLISPLHLPEERLTATKLAGTLFGLVGVGVIFSNQMEAEGTKALWGGAAIVLGAFAVAYGNVLVKARGARFDLGALALFQMFFGLLPLLAASFALEGSPLRWRWTPRAVVCLLYLALVGSALAFLLFYWLLRHVEVAKAQLLPLVTPIVAIALSFVFLNEIPTWRAAAGSASVLIGVLLILRPARKPG